MKSSMSLAVLALVENVSASEVFRHHNKNHHHLSQGKAGRNYESPFYKKTKPGANWFDLDDPTERLHGTEKQDNFSPYDPDVVNAPEDMARVGNDHQALENNKLAPKGYYNGFFFKDYKGNYAQVNSRKMKHHHHHNPHRQYVQYNAHKRDEDDLLTDKELRRVERSNRGIDEQDFVQYNAHKRDEDDLLTDKELRRVEKSNRGIEDQDFVQFNHEDDTEDIDPTQNTFAQRGSAKFRMA